MPNLYIIAGPNGAGKSTFAETFLPVYEECMEFVNADLIARGLSPFSPETALLQAGRLTLKRIRSLMERGVDFAFETTLSGRTFVSFLREARDRGYTIRMVYVWLSGVDVSIERVADRVRRGGHDVPVDVLQRRFRRSASNFIHVYRPLLDSWAVFDNSANAPRLIARFESGQLRVLDPAVYATLEHQAEQT